MHDFLLAKQIINEIIKIAKERDLSDIKSVTLEIGSIALAHDNVPAESGVDASHLYAKHTEDISIDNLEFGIKNLAKNTVLEKARFNIIKTKENYWKIRDIST